ncbi:hypothetical protein L596_022995 [Steinernema carpocapsae]|uniref:G-protein coupled receptors family 1 profile domain-containing protein n=1 Tax=Steinernema carpocapsae TaxID=34508 RepID=A0A4U5MC91_STECR|nr:hypothetical protein L596_022995 [Steinernema carpocapsae]
MMLTNLILVNYVIQHACSSFTVIINPVVIYRLLKPKSENHYTLLIMNIFFHWLFAVSVVMHNGYVFYEAAGKFLNLNRQTENYFLAGYSNSFLIFSTGLFRALTFITTGLSDFFVALDRYMAISNPLTYFLSYKKRLFTASYTTTFVAFFALLIICLLNQIKPKEGAILAMDFVNPSIGDGIFVINTTLFILYSLISLRFLFKLGYYRRNPAVATSQRNMKKVTKN